MSKKQIIIFTIAVIILLAGVAGLFLFPFSPFYQAPKPKPISQPAPVRISSVRGEIVELTETKIIISQDDKTYTFPATSIQDVNKLVTGSVEAGDAKTVAVDKTELKVGQSVLLIAEKNLSWIRAVYILN